VLDVIKPVPSTPNLSAIDGYAGSCAVTTQQESEAALDIITDLTLQLHQAHEARTAALARMEQLEAQQEQAQLEKQEHAESARLAAELSARLTEAEAAAQAAAALAEAAAAATQALAAEPGQLGGWQQRAWLPSLQLGLSSDMNARFPNSSLAAHTPSAPIQAGAAAASPAALYTFLAALGCGALAMLAYVRGRRAVLAQATRAAQLSARLKEASFAKDTAEHSLALLEAELQCRMKQLDEAQQKAADAGAELATRV
jgi:septal ring factor EnvC (AmiA/AmiB activator)